MMTAHAVLAARGEWVTNEKRILERAGLRDVDEIIAGLPAEPRSLEYAIKEVRRRFDGVLHEAMQELPSDANLSQTADGVPQVAMSDGTLPVYAEAATFLRSPSIPGRGVESQKRSARTVSAAGTRVLVCENRWVKEGMAGQRSAPQAS